MVMKSDITLESIDVANKIRNDTGKNNCLMLLYNRKETQLPDVS